MLNLPLMTLKNLLLTLKQHIKPLLAKTSHKMLKNNLWVLLKLYLDHGITQELMFTDKWTTFLIHGELLLTFKQWCLVTWVKHQELVLHSLVTLQLVNQDLWVNTLWTHKVKTLLLVLELLKKLKHLLKNTIQQFINNFLTLLQNLKSISTICKIWNLPFKKVSFICFKQEMVRELQLLHFVLLATLLMKVWLMKNKQFWWLTQNLLTNFYTHNLMLNHLKLQKKLVQVLMHHLVLLQVKLFLKLTMLLTGLKIKVKRRLFLFVLKHLQKTLLVCNMLKVFWPFVVVWHLTLPLLLVVWVLAVFLVAEILVKLLLMKKRKLSQSMV